LVVRPTFDAVVMFAKVPQTGKVKSRLGASIGQAEAALLYGMFLRYLSWQLWKLPKALKPFIAVAPGPYIEGIRKYLPYSPRVPLFRQKGKDLGARMLQATGEARQRGARKVLLIGSDCLELTPGYLSRAQRVLDRKELVLGKARDGGFTLLGWKEPLPSCFKGVAWSSSQVLRKTVWNARKHGVTIGLLPSLADVDEKRDLKRLSRRLDERNPVTKVLRSALVLTAI